MEKLSCGEQILSQESHSLGSEGSLSMGVGIALDLWSCTRPESGLGSIVLDVLVRFVTTRFVIHKAPGVHHSIPWPTIMT